jgi:hypothetical protein
MSWATCYSGSNNIHFNFPPIMADGRLYSSYQPEAVINNTIRQQEHIKTNWGYRQYLTNNAVEIMQTNNTEYCKDVGLPSHYTTLSNPSSNVPYMFNGVYDNNKPGFGYSNSDLKNPYLSREQLQSRMISPSIYIAPYGNQ